MHFRARVVAALVALAATISVTAPTAAVEPIDLRELDPDGRSWPELPAPDPDPSPRVPEPRIFSPGSTTAPAPSAQPTARPTPRATPTPTPTPTPAPDPVGYDISYPQCGEEYPDEFAFAIVGVNGGRVYRANPCLGPDGDGASQLEWAGPDADLYVNTANPGPWVSRYWPRGQTEPRACDVGDGGDDTLDCAYVYGWNAARDSYLTALDAFIALGWADEDAERIPGERTWWLDVEPANTWRWDRARNVEALAGAVAFLESMEVGEIGFYSTPRLWGRITAATDRFSEYSAWHAGASDEEDARRRCAEEEAFTGGELRMVQWVEDGLDHNIRCDQS